MRAYEDYATLDHLSGGRLELIIGKGNGAAQRELFDVTVDDQWERHIEGYELFRRLWREERTTWKGRFRPPLEEAEVWPEPLQTPIRVWHGSATSRESVHHERLGNTVIHVHADAGGLTGAQHRDSLELFQSEVAPPLRTAIPDPPWPANG